MKLYNNMTVSLILPENPTKVEAFAGEEVKKYLTKIFGSVTFAEGAQLQFMIGKAGISSGLPSWSRPPKNCPCRCRIRWSLPPATVLTVAVCGSPAAVRPWKTCWYEKNIATSNEAEKEEKSGYR